jgi:UDPglucose 6-dehydrogenase
VRICVFGLGHLGTVTAACLAAAGHDVIGLDPSPAVVAGLAAGDPPVDEPGLRELLARFAPAFTTGVEEAVAGADAVWLADDTPVDEQDAADVGWVLERAEPVLAAARPGALVLVSSQLPVGTVASLEEAHPTLRFACMPENLRLGRAVETFRDPDRVVAGVRDESARDDVSRLLAATADRIVWMSVESAEMTKHALNAFLATSVAFANELAAICELTGANAREVEAGLRTDPRVGTQAYVSAGQPFSGGTLARDVAYLRTMGRSTALLDGVVESNEEHRNWARRHLEDSGARTVAVWGLAYKPGTESTRRSEAVALCAWLADRGVEVRVHDPAVRTLPETLERKAVRHADPLAAAESADALVLAVAWPEYGHVPAAAVAAAMTGTLVLDPFGTAADTLGREPGIRYVSVGAAA